MIPARLIPSRQRWGSIASPRTVLLLALLAGVGIVLRLLDAGGPRAPSAGGGVETGGIAWRGAAVVLGLAAAFVGMMLVRRRAAGAGPGDARSDAWARWLGAAGANRPVRLVHSSRLGSRATVHVVQWGGTEYLVGCTEQALTVLGRRPCPREGDGPAEAVTSSGTIDPRASVSWERP